MAEPPKSASSPRRQPTVQTGGGPLFGRFRDDRWQGGGGTVDGPSSRWFESLEQRPKSGHPPDSSPSSQTERAPKEAASSAPTGLGRYAVPLLILAFALATSSIVLPVIALVLWVQRRKLFPNFSPPWRDPARVRAWAERYRARRGADAKPLPTPLARWLSDPPYADPAAFRVWIDRRLAQAFLALCGLILLFRALSSLN